ncbi:type II secretion system protein N [Marinagarivorans algicola]|uniref:type II secretion system protein N n=1 Tax=Marinagarivorans algicola TaxID=1513270 RepID=UPI0006B90221|nr:type II secretion system protein N [Marinagarivorans algicola]
MPQFITRLLKILIILGLFIYLVSAIVVRVPATLVTSNLAKALPQLQLAVVSGTAWVGKSGDASIEVQGQAIRLGILRWKFQPLKLLALKMCVDLESEVFSGNVCRTLTGRNQVYKFQAELPASLANHFNREVQFAGMASLNILRGEVTDKGFVKTLEGSVSWRGARVNVQNMWFTLGDFAADVINAGDGSIKATVFDLAGPFGVKLDAVAGINTAPSAQGTILPKSNAQDEIKDVLGLFAVPQENGAFAVKYPL